MMFYHWLGSDAADAAREQAEADQRAVDFAEMAGAVFTVDHTDPQADE